MKMKKYLTFLLGVICTMSLTADSVQQKKIMAGFFETDITPAVGMERPGNYFKVFIQEIREPLKARASFITDGKMKLAMVGLDIIGIPKEISEPVKEAFPDMTVVLSPSHAHNAGPARSFKTPEYLSALAKQLYEKETIQGNQDYVRQVVLQVISAIKMAVIRAEEVNLSFGRGNVEGVSFNRGFKMKNGHRATHPGKGNPDIVEPFEPIDTEVGTVGFWRKSDNSFLGCLVTFNCHATCAPVGGVNADWPGQMVKTIRAVMGENSGVTYIYGCAGDVTQIDNQSLSPMESGPESARLIGVSVGAEALKILMKAKRGDISTLKVIEDQMTLERRKPSEKSLKEALKTVKLWKRDAAFHFAKSRLILGETIVHNPKLEVRVQAIQIGPLVILTFPGELFSIIGLRIKQQSKFPFTWVSSMVYSIGYIPSSKALDPKTGGGYETRLGASTCLPGTDDKMVAKGLELIGKLKPDPVPVGPQIKPVTTIWEYGNNLPEME